MPSYPSNQVTVFQSETAVYPSAAPYHPAEAYPEYGFSEVGSEANAAYAAVRQCFRLAGLDAEHFGTPDWNPLSSLIRPGETVLLKPNMVKEKHPRDPEGWQYVVTHGSVIRAVADYIWKALEGRGRLLLADAPQTDSSFSALVRVLGLDSLAEFYRSHGLNLEVIDLRQEEWVSEAGVIVSRHKVEGDPEGGVALNLGSASEFVGHAGEGNYYGADYDSGQVNHHHSGGRHEYLISGSVIKCDVLFSLPKLKCHKKAGVTATLKNLVGVNADKNWLPHHTEGAPEKGGDEHPQPGAKHRLERSVAAGLRRVIVKFPGVGPWLMQRARRVGTHVFGDTETVIRSGNWFGNDTIWRMCLDLNKVVAYGNHDGSLREPRLENRKRHYALVDGIIAGESRGPMNPDPVAAGVLLFGIEPPTVDAACAYFMGFDPDKVPIVSHAFATRGYPLTAHAWRDTVVRSNVAAWNGKLESISDEATFHFEPHFGWKGRIERKAIPAPVAIEVVK